MSPVGHSLVAFSVGVLTLPPQKTLRWKIVYFTGLAWVSLLPDWPLSFWGHKRYDISHSIFVNAALIGVTLLVFWYRPSLKTYIGGKPVLWGGCFVWFIHLFLDTLYNHGQGIALYWPFSEAHLALPLPWFNEMIGARSFSLRRALHVATIEFLFYSPLLMLAVYWRQRASKIERYTSV